MSNEKPNNVSRAVAGVSAANRLGLDYLSEASKLQPRSRPIIDVHSHLDGALAVPVYERAAQAYGIGLTYSMTPFSSVPLVQRLLGDKVRFITMPDFGSIGQPGTKLAHLFGAGYAEQIATMHSDGARVAKFWSAPRRLDIAARLGTDDALRLDAPNTLEAMSAACERGMAIMVHVGDPDTWFATRYRDNKRYGTKLEQYEPLEEVLERFDRPFIAAHWGGWPEDLGFLTNLLSRHDNLYLDTSATKWAVREISRHVRDALIEFLTKWKGRILFGSDIVTKDAHVEEATTEQGTAFDLYASRYWALRTMLETDYDGPSPIADPDLAMVDPSSHTDMDAPPLKGKNLPIELLNSVYHEAASALLDPLYE